MILSGFGQSLAIAGIIIAFYVMDAAMFTRYDRQRQQGGSGKAWCYTLMMLLLAAALVAQPVVLPQWGLHIHARWGIAIQLAGLAMALGGLTLHTWARLHLQHYYTERVEHQSEHVVVDTGPYAYVRHPTFASFLLITVGVLLINPALTTLLTVCYAMWDFSRAARQEETLLAARLPGYAEYMARTPRFLPRPGLRAAGASRKTARKGEERD